MTWTSPGAPRRRLARGLLVAVGIGLPTLFALLGATRTPTIAYLFFLREGLPAPAEDGGVERVTKAVKDGGFEPRALSVLAADSPAVPRDQAGQREVLQRVIGDAHGVVAFWVERGDDGSLEMRSALLSRTDFEVAPGIRGTFTGDLERVVDVGSRDERGDAIERLSVRAVTRLKSAGDAATPSASRRDTTTARSGSLPANLSLAVLSFSRDWLVTEQEVQVSFGDLPLKLRFQDRVYELLNDLRQTGPPWDGVKNYRLNRSAQVTYAQMFAPVLVIGSQANPRAREDQLKALCGRANADGLVFGHLQMEPGKPLYLYVQFFVAANEKWYTHRSEWAKGWRNDDVMSALRMGLEAVGRQAAEALVDGSDTTALGAPRHTTTAASPSQRRVSPQPGPSSESARRLGMASRATPMSSSVTYRIRKGDGLFSLARNCYRARGPAVPRTAKQIETFNRLPAQGLEVERTIELPRSIEGLRLRRECGGG